VLVLLLGKAIRMSEQVKWQQVEVAGWVKMSESDFV